MKARILEAHTSPPGNGAWQAEAIIDVEIQLAGIELIVRGITVRSKASEGKTFFGMKSFKRDENWVQTVDFPSHNKELQAALLDAWRAFDGPVGKPVDSVEQPEMIMAPNHQQFAPTARVAKPNPAMLAECPF